MQLVPHRRRNRVVSSTATRVYQCLEWLLVLGIALRGIHTWQWLAWSNEAYGPWSWSQVFSTFDLQNIPNLGPWQIVLLAALVVIATTFEGRSHWLSLLLYVVIFPQMIAQRKCGIVNAEDSSKHQCLSTSFQISVVSFLQEFLQYYRPLDHWTPAADQVIQNIGFMLSSSNVYTAAVHLQVLRLGRALVGSSLNLVELDLLCHAFTTFTMYYFGAMTTQQSTSMPETFFFAFMYGLLLGIYPSMTFLRRNMRLAKVRPQHRWKNLHKEQYEYAIYVYAILTFVILTLVRSFLQWRLLRDPFIVVVEYIISEPMRMFLVLYWAGTATLGVIVVIYFWGSKPVGGLSGFGQSARRLLRHSTENDLHKSTDAEDVYFEEEGTSAKRARALDRRRKFFHGLVVVMFLPTINLDPDLSYLALSLAFTAFMFEEVLRVTVLPPFGVVIHKFLSGFTDHRDKAGHLVVSHLFLLLGIAGPVWLTRTGQVRQTQDEAIAMLSGVLTLGAGDAAASIVGKKFGRHKWPSLHKSIEGTMAFVFAMLAAAYIAQLLTNGAKIDWTSFSIGVLMTGLLEAVSTENDNLITPVYMWCLVY